MDENTRKVLEALIGLTKKRVEGIGFNEWRREVVDKRNIVALRTFQKIRDDLISAEVVTKTQHPIHKSAHLYSPRSEIIEIYKTVEEFLAIPDEMEAKFLASDDEREFVKNIFIPTLNHVFLQTYKVLKKMEYKESRKLLLYFAAEVAVRLYKYTEPSEWSKKPNVIRDRSGYYIKKSDREDKGKNIAL